MSKSSPNASLQTQVARFMTTIDNKIRRVFNNDFFGIYEGVIEIINDDQATISVSVADLDNALLENCRVAFPGLSSNSKVSPTFIVGTTVLVLCTSFNLYNPIIIGQLSPSNNIISPLNADELNIENGAGSIRIGSDGVINIIGTSVTINGTNIILSGSTITANGEDLTDDDIGIL